MQDANHRKHKEQVKPNTTIGLTEPIKAALCHTRRKNSKHSEAFSKQG